MRETLETLARELGYSYRRPEGAKKEEAPCVTGISVDSRSVQAGDLFVAIAGETTDGHRYLRQALERGAAAVAVSDERAALDAGIGTYLLVDDGLHMIQRLAAWLRRRTSAPVIAVTGSTGKTSTKDFLAALLSALGPVVATHGNQNTELGVPLTLCRLEETTRAVVLEMGMRGLGQIDFLCRLAAPDHGIITNIGLVHSEFVGSRENIAKAKCEMLPYLREDSVLVLNKKDEPLLTPWLKDFRGRVVWFHETDARCDLWADEIREEADSVEYRLHWRDGTAERSQWITLPGLGPHNVSNSLAAAACALSLGVPWEEIGPRLGAAQLSGQRLKVAVNAAGVSVIDDAYNANPDSVKSALRVLRSREGARRIAVLGAMLELGQYEEACHREMGKFAATLGLDRLVAVGRLGRLLGESAAEAGMDVAFAADNEEAIQILRAYLKPGDVVLVKGSHLANLEPIVQSLMG